MLKPIEDKVLLKLKKEEEVTRGGIILASNSKYKTQTATVIAVGDGNISSDEKKIMVVNENDTVYIEKGVGTLIEYEGEEYLLVKQSEILAIEK